jgi:hypothetical protein
LEHFKNAYEKEASKTQKFPPTSEIHTKPDRDFFVREEDLEPDKDFSIPEEGEEKVE